MGGRDKFKWRVQVQRQDGEVGEVDFESYWSPDRDFVTGDSIANAAAAELSVASGEAKIKYHGLSAILV